MITTHSAIFIPAVAVFIMAGLTAFYIWKWRGHRLRMSAPEDSFTFALGLLVQFCAVMLFFVSGLAVLFGWAIGNPYLFNAGAGMPVAPSTAVLFMLFAAAIFLRSQFPSSRPAYRAGMWIGLVCGLIASVLLVLSYQGIYLNIEHIGISHSHIVGQVPIGHMSPVTAACFLLASLSYLMLLSSPQGSRRVSLAWGLAFVLVAIACPLLLAYIFGMPILYGSAYIPPAALTSAGFIVLGFALMGLSAPRTWLMLHYKNDSSVRAGYIYAGIFTLLAVSIITVGYRSYRNFEVQFREGMENQISIVADLKVDELKNWRKERMADAHLIYGNPAFSKLAARYLINPGNSATREQVRVWLGE